MSNVENVLYTSEYNKFLDRKIKEDPEFFCKEFQNVTEKLKNECNRPTENFEKNIRYYEAQIRILKERMACQLLKEHGYEYQEYYIFGLNDVHASDRWQ